jgi:hypothetical protein
MPLCRWRRYRPGGARGAVTSCTPLPPAIGPTRGTGRPGASRLFGCGVASKASGAAGELLLFCPLKKSTNESGQFLL